MTGIRLATGVFLASALIGVNPGARAELHDLDFSTRARYADLENAGNPGKAASIRFRGGIHSQWSPSFSSTLEVDHISSTFQDDHSDGVRFNGQPLIPDAPSTDLNQLFFTYENSLIDARLGRQRIELDDQRFIGSVEFWQNDQTFDALFSSIHLFSASKFNYGYLWKANRIFGPDADEDLQTSDINFEALNGRRPAGNLGEHSHDSHLLRFEMNEWDFSRFVIYSYFIDTDDAPSTSSRNIGGSYSVKFKPSVLQYRAKIEAAKQRRSEINGEPEPHFFHIEAAIGYRSVELELQQDIIAADKGTSFFASLGSGHEFQGWADIFGGAPSSGLIDRSLRLTWRAAPWKLDLRYHFFSADEGSADLGEELDIDLIFKPHENHSLHLRFADYKANAEDASRADRRRIFLSYSFKFNTSI